VNHLISTSLANPFDAYPKIESFKTAMPLSAGTVDEIVAPIGSGGIGEVYRARDTA
jgi:hypothetical protein